MGVSDAIQLEAQVRCALISEGLCPYCRGPLVIPDRSIRWAVCVPCEVAHRASGNGLDDFTASPLLYAMAEWQRECYEHIEQLMVDGETFIDGQRYFLAPRQHVNPIESPLRAIYESFEPDED